MSRTPSRTRHPATDLSAPANPAQVVVVAGTDIMAGLAATARPMGRPKLNLEDFEDELIGRLCVGQSLLSICREDHMPSYEWTMKLAARDPAFQERLDRARARGMEALVDLQIDILSGGEFSTGETHRDRELVAAIRWVAGKRNAAKFGDRLLPEGGVMIVARPSSEDGLDGLLT